MPLAPEIVFKSLLAVRRPVLPLLLLQAVKASEVTVSNARVDVGTTDFTGDRSSESPIHARFVSNLDFWAVAEEQQAVSAGAESKHHLSLSNSDHVRRAAALLAGAFVRPAEQGGDLVA